MTHPGLPGRTGGLQESQKAHEGLACGLWQLEPQSDHRLQLHLAALERIP